MKHRHFYLLIITSSVLIVSFTYPGLFNISPWSTIAASPDPYSEDYVGYTAISGPDDRLDTGASNKAVTATFVVASPLVSDDFDRCTLDTTVHYKKY